MSIKLQFGNRWGKDTQPKWTNISKWDKKEKNRAPTKAKKRKRKDQQRIVSNKSNKRNSNNYDAYNFI
mgnify:CR=1 FL=1